VTLTTTVSGDVVVGTAVTALNDQVGITAADNVTLTGTIDAAVATIGGSGDQRRRSGDGGDFQSGCGHGIGNATALNLASTTIDADTTDGNIDIANAAPGAVTVNSLTTGVGHDHVCADGQPDLGCDHGDDGRRIYRYWQ